MGRKTYVVGVGMTKFEKPQSKDWDYPDMARESISMALDDSKIPYDAIEQACVGYVYGESTCGQRAIYQFGLTGIPVYNVNNNCSTGSTALFMARQLVEGGIADCVLALGFEKMQKGSLGSTFNDRTNPMDKHITSMIEKREFTGAPPAPWMFGNAGRDHMERYGSNADHFAWIGWKNHKHSVNNPYAQFQTEYSFEDIKSAPMIYEPLTKLQCSPTSDGSGAAIVCSEEVVKKYGLSGQAIEIKAQAMVTDTQATFDAGDSIHLVGYDMSKKAADTVYAKSGLSPEDVDVIELHDCFSANELITYEALGLAEEGKGAQLVDDEATTYGGKWVVNPSGGLISKGHPLGATGLAQCAEINWQLRGLADKRQVDGAKVGLQHNIGLGGACVVTMYTQPAFA
jgi:acetyl-CoA acyltransferase